MKFNFNRKIKIGNFSVSLAALFVIGLVLVAVGLNMSGGSYLGGVEHSIEAYTPDENGVPQFATELPRGVKVSVHRDTVKLEDVVLTAITYDGEEYYVNKENIVSNSNDVVQEKEVYVRTPVTVYKNDDGPEIASYMPKGSCMKILECGELLDNGYVDMYKVEYTDPAGESGEGYVYGKYMAGTQEKADVNYNANGEYNRAKKARYGFDLYGGLATNLDWFPYEKTEIEGNELCTDARTMYINTEAAIYPDKYVELIKETGCNAVCIDIKDGPLTYKSEIAKEVSPYSYKKAFAKEEDFAKGVKAYKDTGVYLIGRIVVFNDTRYAKDHPEDCIKSPGTTKGWPSAFSRDVWEYNVRLAREAVEKFGFDEIQFDYVRFPESSYEMSQNDKTDFRNRYGEDKCSAIQNFCFYAADQLRESGAYISVDVFGESAYGYVTAYGQYWPAISNIVDAISAMPYTDHTGGEGAWNKPYQTVNNWAERGAKSQKHLSNPAVARTWVTGYSTPYWNPTVNCDENYLREQIRGLEDAGLTGGFIPWNVLSDLDKYKQYRAIWNE